MSEIRYRHKLEPVLYDSLKILLEIVFPDDIRLNIDSLNSDNSELTIIYERMGIHGYPIPLGYSSESDYEILVFESPGGERELRNIVGNIEALDNEKGLREAVHKVKSKKPQEGSEYSGTSCRLYETTELREEKVDIKTLRITASECDKVQIVCIRSLNPGLELNKLYERVYQNLNMGLVETEYTEDIHISRNGYFRFCTRKGNSRNGVVELEVLDDFEVDKLRNLY